MGLIYTTIQHVFRKQHSLTCNEYVLADMIYHLCRQPKSAHPGWCYMSRPEIAEEIGLTKQTILNLIDSLIQKEIIIKNPRNSFLQVSEIWGSTFFTAGGKESLPHGGKESLPNNYNLDNNIDNNNREDELNNSSPDNSSFNPKNTKKEKKSGGAAKKNEPNPLFVSCKDYWLTDIHPGWSFGMVQGASLKSIISKLRALCLQTRSNCTDDDILGLFKVLCTGMPDWFQDKELQVINSKFNEIVTELKNKRNGKTTTKGESKYRPQR